MGEKREREAHKRGGKTEGGGEVEEKAVSVGTWLTLSVGSTVRGRRKGRTLVASSILSIPSFLFLSTSWYIPEGRERGGERERERERERETTRDTYRYWLITRLNTQGEYE